MTPNHHPDKGSSGTAADPEPALEVRRPLQGLNANQDPFAPTEPEEGWKLEEWAKFDGPPSVEVSTQNHVEVLQPLDPLGLVQPTAQQEVDPFKEGVCKNKGRPEALRWTITTQEEEEEAANYLSSLERKLERLMKSKEKAVGSASDGVAAELAARIEDTDYQSQYEDDSVDSRPQVSLIQDVEVVEKPLSTWEGEGEKEGVDGEGGKGGEASSEGEEEDTEESGSEQDEVEYGTL
eukprot:comp22999_c2_seq1/m.36637 comp22999_c2_seq1/g.36637  ORF comp22999_c2_seq1/g.36637 comp22999_c2_seq1/m.36637 type:complete len:236 (-) comp22999_c2_seq1:288-995(-)